MPSNNDIQPRSTYLYRQKLSCCHLLLLLVITYYNWNLVCVCAHAVFRKSKYDLLLDFTFAEILAMIKLNGEYCY